MNLSWIKGAIIAAGVASTFWSIIAFSWIYLLYSCGEEDKKPVKVKTLGISAALSVLILFSSFVAYNNKWLDPNWRIALEVSKRLDKYVEANPGSVYDPDRLLEEVDKSIVSVFESVQRVPGIIAKLTDGKTMEVIKAEINAQRDKEQFDAFRAWQKSQK